MAKGTSLRLFAKLLDQSAAPVWVISPRGRIAFVSAGCAAWLGVDPGALLDRQSIAGAPVSADPLDSVAAALSPPPGFAQRGTASLKVHPPPCGPHRPGMIEARFVRVGHGAAAFTLGVGGDFADRIADSDLDDAVAIRQRLDRWRREQTDLATVIAAGDSFAARRLRRRLQVAARVRADMAFVGPPGCGSEAIAVRVHALAAPQEPINSIDGPLMDAELLEATLSALIHPLTQSNDARATVLVRSLNQMPLEAQHYLASLLDRFRGRLRLLGLCETTVAASPSGSLHAEAGEVEGLADSVPPCGLQPRLAESLSAMVLTVDALTARVEDLPTLASALLNQHRAAGTTVADRFSRGALDALILYPWPGNFAELQAAIDHAARRATDASVNPDQLPLAIRTYSSGRSSAPPPSPDQSLDEAIAALELRLISEAIEAAAGNRAEAARRLGISRSRLLRRLQDSPHPQSPHPQSPHPQSPHPQSPNFGTQEL